MSDALAEIRADAVRTLRQVLRWQLPDARWELLGGMLDVLATAAAEEDPDAITVVAVDLELAGPMRITPIGTTREGWHEAPPRIRERVNELIHVLGRGSESGAESGTDPREADRAPGRERGRK